MANRNKPRVHARDHEHGGADPQQIVYEDVGGGGTPAPSGVSFFTAEAYSTSGPAASSTIDLTFTDPDGFYTNDPSSFELVSDRVRILRAGGYQVTGTVSVGGFTSETDPAAVADISELKGIDAASNSDYGIVNLSPTAAWITRGLLPGSGGTAPPIQYPNFFNLQDAYGYGGPRPVVWPFTLHMTMSWSVDDDHLLDYSLVGIRAA